MREVVEDLGKHFDAGHQPGPTGPNRASR
jgi:hypothetical protein